MNKNIVICEKTVKCSIFNHFLMKIIDQTYFDENIIPQKCK